ncbi:MAG: CoB--CoM heterodisulfide reductase iron-sulfur subunit B family protein [Desulfobacter sp.]|nr:MAG: CoB--CoM heterodisulfide reductase iron-sulfur subunit B family protein [Desulfobacter sp.]
MRLAYFPGCKINFHLPAYGKAVEKLMRHLGITLVRLPFNCCGNPARGKDPAASVLAAMTNIALAQARGLDIFTPCKCCFGQLKHGMHWYATDPRIREQVDTALAGEGMVVNDSCLVEEADTGRLARRQVEIRHLLDFLYHDIGVEKLAAMVTTPLPPERVVLQQGCHALRPFSVTRFDNPFAPRIFRELVQCTGLEVLDWNKETECCGDPAAETHSSLAAKILSGKLAHAKKAGAGWICTACTHCQIQYERYGGADIRALPFALVLGGALGITPIKGMNTA